MSTTSYKYSKLSDAAKQTARESFADYYISAFLANDLEIISGKADHDTDMITINRLLVENKFMTHDQIKELSVSRNQANYDRILDALPMKYKKSGEPAEQWAAWVEDIRLKEPNED